MRQAMRQLGYISAAVLLLISGGTIIPAAEPFGSGPPAVISLAADGIQRATIILDSYSYTPGHVVVGAGEPVELTLASIATIIPRNCVITDPAGSIYVEQDIGPARQLS